MQTITLVSGNANKVAEWQNQLPSSITLLSQDIDLPEIQSDDSVEIITDKVKKAFEHVGSAVVVEDVSLSLPRLNGLPGPFIKFWLKPCSDGSIPLHKIIQANEKVIATCTIGFYDGNELVIAEGIVNGTIVSPRGNLGFGFDILFKPDGYSLAYAEMDITQKNKISHRALAIQDLVQKITK